MDFILNLLRDPIWGFLGALFAFVAIPASYWIFVLQRKVKELAFGVLSVRRLFSVDPQVASRIAVTFDGKPIGDLHLAVIGLKNSGTEPILATDFAQPITFNLNAGTTILSAEITRQSPENLGFKLHVHEPMIQLDSVLLNAGDYVLFQVLLSGNEPRVTHSLRVVGVAELELLQNDPLRLTKELTPWQSAKLWLTWLGALAFLVFYGVNAIYFYTPRNAIFFGGLLTFLVSGIAIIALRARYSPKFRRYIPDL